MWTINKFQTKLLFKEFWVCFYKTLNMTNRLLSWIQRSQLWHIKQKTKTILYHKSTNFIPVKIKNFFVSKYQWIVLVVFFLFPSLWGQFCSYDIYCILASWQLYCYCPYFTTIKYCKGNSSKNLLIISLLSLLYNNLICIIIYCKGHSSKNLLVGVFILKIIILIYPWSYL